MRPQKLSAARGGKADDLQMISGVGPKLEGTLNGLGFYHYDQIANWNKDEVDWVDDSLSFKGRIERDEWIPQAKLLSSGDMGKFNTLYGGGGGKKAAPRKASSKTATSARAAKPKAAQPKKAAAPAKRKVTGKPVRPRKLSAARRGKADNLQQISGVGPKLEKTLFGLGFFHFDQISVWNKDEIDWVDEHLRFKGRIERDEWIPQCKLLAAGKMAQFAKKYGTGGLTNKAGQTKSGTRTRKS